MPICESYNPITGGNWEETGVKPNIIATSEDAFSIAYTKAIENIISKSKDNIYRKELENVLENILIRTH